MTSETWWHVGPTWLQSHDTHWMTRDSENVKWLNVFQQTIQTISVRWTRHSKVTIKTSRRLSCRCEMKRAVSRRRTGWLACRRTLDLVSLRPSSHHHRHSAFQQTLVCACRARTTHVDRTCQSAVLDHLPYQHVTVVLDHPPARRKSRAWPPANTSSQPCSTSH